MKAQWLKYYLKIMVCLEIIHIHMSINCRYYWGDCTQLNHNLNKIYTVIRSTLDKTFSHLQIYCYLIVLNTFKISFYSWALSKLFIFYNAHIEHWHPSYKMFLFFFKKKGKKKRFACDFAVLEENYYEIWATLSILWGGNLIQNQPQSF